MCEQNAKHSRACACTTPAGDVIRGNMTAHETGADSLPASLGSLHKRALVSTDHSSALGSGTLKPESTQK